MSTVKKVFFGVLAGVLGVLCAFFGYLFFAGQAWATTIYDATTQMSIVKYVPTSDSGLGGDSSDVGTQTGDWILPIILVVLAVIAISLIVIMITKRKSLRNGGAIGCTIALVLCLGAGGFALGNLQKAQAHADDEPEQEIQHTSGTFVSDTMEIKCNEAGGEITYGEDPCSNRQVFTNTSDRSILLKGISIEGDSSIGNWTATAEEMGRQLFSGTAGDSVTFDNPIVLRSGDSIPITWSTTQQSEDLILLAGTSPASIKYDFADADYTVDFETNGGVPIPEKQVINYGSYVVRPDDPIKENYTLVCWCSDKELTQEWNFDENFVEKDTTLYAKWTVSKEYREASIAKMQNYVDSAFAEIDNCNEVSADIKQANKDAIQEIFNTAEVKIMDETITTVEEVDAIRADAEAQILPIVKNNAVVDLEGFEVKAVKMVEDIDEQFLTKEQKEAIKQEINKTIADACNLINQSSTDTIEKVTEIRTSTEKDLEAKAHELANAIIVAVGKAASDVVSNMEGLTDADKARYNEQIQGLCSSAKKTAESEKDITKLPNILLEFGNDMTDLVKEAQALSDAKLDAYAKLEKALGDAKDVVDGCMNLKKATKDSYKEELNASYNSDKAKIANAENVDGVKSALETGLSNINTIKQNALNEEAKSAWTIKYEMNGHGSAISSQYIKYGEKINDPHATDPQYTIIGWYTDKELTQLWDFDKNKVGDVPSDVCEMTLYAKWTVSKEYREAAIADMKVYLDKANAEIDSCTDLTQSVRDANKETNQNIYDVAAEKIMNEATTTVEEVDNYKATAQKAILGIVKNNAVADLDAVLAKDCGLIDSINDEMLSTSEKSAVKVEIYSIIENAKATIQTKINLNATDNIAEVTKVRTQAIAEADAKVRGAGDLAVDNYAVAIKNKIAKYTGLTDGDRTRFNGEIDTAIANTKAACAAETDITKIPGLLDAYKVSLDNLDKAAKDLSEAKIAARSELSTTTTNAKGVIDGCRNLKKVTKDNYITQIEAKSTTAETNIDNAITVADVNSALLQGKSDINAIMENAVAEDAASTWTVKFDINGHGSAISSQNKKWGTSVDEPTISAVKGYTFGGWYTDKALANPWNFSTNKVGDVPSDVCEMTLYAKWTANPYVVDFNANGGSGSMASQSRVYDDGIALPDNKFVRSGYSFVEWNTKADGSGKSFTNMSTENVADVAGANVVLFAQWYKEPAAYAYLNTGSGDGTSLTLCFDQNKEEIEAAGNTTFSILDAETPAWDGSKGNIKTVVFDASFASYPVTTCQNWFSGCNDLRTIDSLNNLNTAGVTSMAGMFAGCSRLTNINLNTFNVGAVTSFDNMFSGCSNLQYIYCEQDWSTMSASSSGMFSGCSRLPNFNDKKVDKTYAYPSNGKTGYFTMPSMVNSSMHQDEEGEAVDNDANIDQEPSDLQSNLDLNSVENETDFSNEDFSTVSDEQEYAHVLQPHYATRMVQTGTTYVVDIPAYDDVAEQGHYEPIYGTEEYVDYYYCSECSFVQSN